jgi:hypothetical protein
VTVFITDMNYDPIAPYHFDLSGTAFGAMATAGLQDKLRHRGIIDLEFRRSDTIIYLARSNKNFFTICVCTRLNAAHSDPALMQQE